MCSVLVASFEQVQPFIVDGNIQRIQRDVIDVSLYKHEQTLERIIERLEEDLSKQYSNLALAKQEEIDDSEIENIKIGIAEQKVQIAVLRQKIWGQWIKSDESTYRAV